MKEDHWRVRKPRPTRVIEQGCLGAIGGVMNIDIKTLGVLGALGMMVGVGISEEREAEPLVKKAFVDGRGQGWRAMEESEFVNVNCAEDTWSWEADGLIKCTGKPVGVIRTKEPVTNFELVVEWRHLESGGNSGVFVWASPASIKNLEAGKGRLPHGIEVQVLDLGYAEKYEKRHKKPSDWFTSHGDVFSDRAGEDDAVSAGGAEREAEFSVEGDDVGDRRVEPLLRAGDQWRGAVVGER